MADNNGIVAYFIKNRPQFFSLLIFVDGSSGPPVYVIADANMPAKVIDCYTIQGADVMST